MGRNCDLHDQITRRCAFTRGQTFAGKPKKLARQDTCRNWNRNTSILQDDLAMLINARLLQMNITRDSQKCVIELNLQSDMLIGAKRPAPAGKSRPALPS